MVLSLFSQAVLEGSKEVQRSKRLKRMLEIILAFGNYMNRGQRGNAVGFKLLSLTREEEPFAYEVANQRFGVFE